MTCHFPSLFPLAGIGDALPNAGWIVVAAIVVVGLLVVGFSDLRRFSLLRIWAISGVCFRESVRRRVLWIIPLAILGVIIVSQLEKAFDEQDVIRQTTKFCLFGAGLVVTLTSIILACTNLPREIENRVIYTVVTKPTTRLEIVLGKILGFSRVSALILVIMGLFTYGYLQLRAWGQEQVVATRLATDVGLSPVERNKLEHYLQTGLLTARSYARPQVMEVMASTDLDGSVQGVPRWSDPWRAIYGDSEEELLFPFTVDRQRFFADPDNPGQTSAAEGIGKTGLLIGVRLIWHRYGPQNDTQIKYGASAGATAGIDLLDANEYSLVAPVYMTDPQHPTVKDANSGSLDLPDENRTERHDAGAEVKFIWAYVPPSRAASLYAQPMFFVHVIGVSHNVQYLAKSSGVVVMTAPALALGQYAPPAPDVLPPTAQLTGVDAGPGGRPLPPFVRGRTSARGGQQLTGVPLNDPHAPYALLHFAGSDLASAQKANPGETPLEIRAGIEHGGDVEEANESSTDIAILVRWAPDAGSLVFSSPVNVKLENKQTAFAAVPPAQVPAEGFDLLVRCNTAGHVVDLSDDSLALMIRQEPFAWNLFKSLLILWMLTVLVVTLAIFASTFVSWPIAVVLTTVLLMGHWCVTQVADASDTTLGRSIATDMGLTDPSRAEAVASSVNALSGALQTVGIALPDIDRFAAIGSIEQGRIVSLSDMADALGVLAGFALPAAVLAYCVLRKKEVAS